MNQNSKSSLSSDIERRSKLYFVVGNVLVLLIILSFLGFMTRNYLQNTLWKDYYYKNAFKFSNNCTAQFTGNDDSLFPTSFSLPAQSLSGLPHPRGYFDSWDIKASTFYHALYRCDIDTTDIRIGKGVNYMHIGWIFGEAIEVTVGERKAIEIRGDDFVSFPITHAELSSPNLVLQIRVTSTNKHRFGLASILPPVITTETKDHFAVLGIQPIYEMMNVVLPLVPAIVLGMLLGFVWMIGLRTRIILTGLFYFTTVLAAGALSLLIPYLPFSATKVYTIGLPLNYLAHVAAACLLLEVFGLLKTRIYHLMNGALVLSALSVLVILGWDGIFPYSQLSAKVLDTIMLVASIFLGVSSSIVTYRESSIRRKRLFFAALILVVATIYRFGHEISRHMSWNTYVSIDFYYSFAMPLFIAGIVFYYLSAFEEDLKNVRQEKKRLVHELAVGHDLLSVLKNTASVRGCMHADIHWDSSNSLNDWRLAWTTGEGDLIVVCGRLRGTSELAALGQVAIQAALNQCKEQDISIPSECLESINRSLINLFHSYVLSDAAALLIRKSLTTTFASAGDMSLLLPGADKIIEGSSAPLGRVKNLVSASHDFNSQPGEKLSFCSVETDNETTIICHSVQIKLAS